ncbi:CPK15 [Symbiodinium sp. KB8]|nr:CPK15 [Symbiodinium sp. KB8]
MDDSTLRSKTTAKELFEWLDFDGSGSVSLQELKRLVTDKEALEVLDSADSSRDGLLSFEEFTELIQSIASRRYGPDPGSPSGDSEQAAKELPTPRATPLGRTMNWRLDSLPPAMRKTM